VAGDIERVAGIRDRKKLRIGEQPEVWNR